MTFPVFCVIFSDFSGLLKFPDWKTLSIFPGFPVRVGTLQILEDREKFATRDHL